MYLLGFPSAFCEKIPEKFIELLPKSEKYILIITDVM